MLVNGRITFTPAGGPSRSRFHLRSGYNLKHQY